MNRKKAVSGKSRLRKTFENKGFYIALFSLMVIMGCSIYLRQIRSDNKSDVSFDDEAWQEALSESGVEFKGSVDNAEQESQAKSEQKTETQTDESAEGVKKTEEKPKDSVNSEKGRNDGTVQTAAEAVPSDGELLMQMPCSGKITANCSIDDLVYCSAMDDWRTHNGIDIAAAEGDAVKAAAAGTVAQVYEDDLLGVVVVIDHGNDMSSLYGNLQSYDFIRTGTKVQAGDIIGGVGKTGALESGESPHLHFEVHKGGEYQNPTSYFSKQ